MSWFGWGKKKKEPEIKEEKKVPAEPKPKFEMWGVSDGSYRIRFSDGWEIEVSRRMFTFLDHFSGRFMSLGMLSQEILMKLLYQLMKQHGLSFEYEEPDEDDDDDDGDDDEPEVDPDSEPDPEEEVEKEVVDEPDPSVATVEAPSEAPAATEGTHRNGVSRPAREALPLRDR